MFAKLAVALVMLTHRCLHNDFIVYHRHEPVSELLQVCCNDRSFGFSHSLVLSTDLISFTTIEIQATYASLFVNSMISPITKSDNFFCHITDAEMVTIM